MNQDIRLVALIVIEEINLAMDFRVWAARCTRCRRADVSLLSDASRGGTPKMYKNELHACAQKNDVVGICKLVEQGLNPRQANFAID